MTAPSFSPGPKAALVVVDVQQAFGDVEFWGTRNNPECEKNIETLIAHWRKTGRPVVFVRHDSTNESSPLHPSSPGNQFKDVITGEPDLLVVKSVNSSFHGTPDLHQWLQQEGVTELVVCGITTNHCCETTARVGGNLATKCSSPWMPPIPSTVNRPRVKSSQLTRWGKSQQRTSTKSSPPSPLQKS